MKFAFERVGFDLAWNCSADEGGPDDVGGYREAGDQALDELEEAVEPFLADMKRRLKLGRVEEARRICMGIVLGMFRASQARENMGALDELPDFPFETAEEAIEIYRGRKQNELEPPSFPVSFWRKTHGGWSDSLEW